MADKSKLRDLNLSQDEIKRLGEALKDEKFRELFREYAEEISDPENRRRYEEEIAQLERERGMDVTFIKPEPGYVLKTSVDGDTKAFINISKSDKIDKPSAKRERGPDGKSGLMWQIPHSFAPPREDLDKSKQRCKVFDFVVHPDTYRMSESNVRFKKMVEDTALDGIERQFGVQLDRKNIKRPKMPFKGIPQAIVKRTRNSEGAQNVPDASGLLQNMPYPYDDKTSAEKAKDRDDAYDMEQKKKKENAAKQKSNLQPNEEKVGDATIPKYSITHRSEVDMQEYRNARDAKPSTRPKALIVKIELPLLNSAAQADLDIFERKLLLESKSPAAYKLDLPLPFPVDESEGSAKFDKQKRVLTVTLPVLQSETPSLPQFNDEADTATETASENPLQKPLIEVISNGIDNDEEPGKQTGVSNETSTPPPSVNGDRKSKPQISFTLPEFTYTQDAETVSFVLKVKSIEIESVQKTCPSPTEVQLQCTSRGSGGFPLHYSLSLKFADGCKIASEHCTVDVTADNMVLLLLKERSSRGLWDRFWAGLDMDALKEHLFLTPSSLQQQLEELDTAAAESEKSANTVDAAAGTATEATSHSLLVTNMDEKKLTIEISSAKNAGTRAAEDEDDDYDPPSSAEIQVVHNHPPPNLHGILKQRTISESSDDVNLDLESPRSGIEDEDELSSSFKRRSVSFSEHIDKATFKTTASVNSMKTVLKSKRRRQRKWEEREKKSSSRRRHNSTGSEGSGDDFTHASDSHSHSEEEASGEVDAETQNSVGAQGGDGHSVLDFRTKQADGKTKKQNKGRGKKKGGQAANYQRSSSQEDSDQSDRTGGDVDENNSLPGTNSFESITEEEKGEATEKEGSLDPGIQAEDVEQGSNLSTGSTVNNGGSTEKNTDLTPSKQVGDAAAAEKQGTDLDDKGSNPNASRDKRLAAEVKAKLAAGPAEGDHEDSDDDWQDAVEENSDKAKAREGADNPPKTSLTWEDGSRGGENNEHRTTCAFAFNNAVMFDLDND